MARVLITVRVIPVKNIIADARRVELVVSHNEDIFGASFAHMTILAEYDSFIKAILNGLTLG